MATTAPIPVIMEPAAARGGDLYWLEAPDRTVIVLVTDEHHLIIYRSSDATDRDESALDGFLDELGVFEFKTDEIHILGSTGLIFRVTYLAL